MPSSTAASCSSLITVIAGFVTTEPVWAAVGVVVGVPGIALPWLSVGRKWSIPTVWVSVSAVIVVDLATLTLMWTTT
jgi:hypothetical protein